MKVTVAIAFFHFLYLSSGLSLRASVDTLPGQSQILSADGDVGKVENSKKVLKDATGKSLEENKSEKEDSGLESTAVESSGEEPSATKQEYAPSEASEVSTKTSGEEPTDFGIERCTKEHLDKIKGFLLDLDGTMYSPSGLLPGVPEFFDFLHEKNTSYVLLSNGFKTKQGVASKFAMKKYKINQKIDPARVHTAGVAVANYAKDKIPKGAKIYAIGSSIEYDDGSKDSLYRILKREVPSKLFNSWDVRLDLTLDEIYEWAALAKAGKPVYVILAVMANPKDSFGDDPVTKKPAYTKMDYDLMKKISVLLRNDAKFVVGAPDVADSQPKSEKYPNIDTAFPTMGGYEQLFMASAEMFPGTDKEKKNHISTGKGGNFGVEYMINPGIELLKQQDSSIDHSNVMIIGDNFGTDILAANQAGIQSMLVLVGAHQLADAKNWQSRPTCYLEDVGKIPEILSG